MRVRADGRSSREHDSDGRESTSLHADCVPEDADGVPSSSECDRR
jgi:hypothetical protein